MTTTKYSTVSQFHRKAERAFRNANPDCDATIEWTWTSRPCPYPGEPGTFRNGRFTVSAPGYRTRTMNATIDCQTGELMVR